MKNLLSEALDIEMGDWYEIDRIHRARKKKQIVWKGIRVRFFQDYAQEVQEKRRKFDEVRRLLQLRVSLLLWLIHGSGFCYTFRPFG